jgi:hypothetical protein
MHFAEFVQSSKQFQATIQQQQQQINPGPPMQHQHCPQGQAEGLKSNYSKLGIDSRSSPPMHAATMPMHARGVPAHNGSAAPAHVHAHASLSSLGRSFPAPLSSQPAQSHKHAPTASHRPLHASTSTASSLSTSRAQPGAFLAALHTHAQAARDAQDLSYDRRLVELLPRTHQGTPQLPCCVPIFTAGWYKLYDRSRTFG